jgi:folate-binding protein YgfZ
LRAEVGIYGPHAAAALAAAGVEGTLPAATFASARLQIAGAAALVVRSDEAGIPGYEIIADPASAAAVRAALERADARPVSDEDLEIVRVESGRPKFGVDMDADTIPLEAGLEDRAISRTKGCYVGQEVIVRVLDRGHGRVARRLVGLTFDAGAAVPAAGTAVTSGDREIGRVTSAVWSPSLARPIALAYVHRDFVEPGTSVRAGSADAVVAALPFVRIPGS